MPTRSLTALLLSILGLAPLHAGVTTLARPAGVSEVPGGIAIDAEGNVYSADFGGSTVLRITPEGRVRVFASGLRTPSGNAFDSAGNLYQSNYRDPANPDAPDSISKIEPDGTVTTFADGLNGPVGIAIDASDTLYVAMCNANNVTRITPEGETSIFAVSPLFACPNGITFDDEGSLYVANFGDGRVVRVTKGGEASLFADLPGAGNGHLAYVAGDLYVAGRNANQVFKVSVPWAGVEVFAGTGSPGSDDGEESVARFNQPNALERSPAGDRLFTNGFGGVVREISLDLPRPPKPQGVKAKAQGAGKVKLRWKDRSRLEEGFTVEMKTATSGWEEVATVGVNTRKLVLRGLERGVEHSFRVSAWNGTASSRPSKPATVTTR